MIFRKSLFLTLTLFFFAIQLSLAGPFYDDNFEIPTEKGKPVICTFFGDEFESYIEDPNGYSIVYDKLYQRYVYATKDINGYLVPTLSIVGVDAPVGDPSRANPQII